MSSVAPSTAAGPSQRADRVIRELDVYVCNNTLGAGTQMYLLQCPLRHPERPYHEHGLQKVRLKPKVRKLSAEAALDTEGRNYNSNVEPSRQIKAQALQSTRLDMRGVQLAGGFVEGDRLMLFPIDEALQVRPSMAHLDREKDAGRKAEGREGAGAEEDKGAAELMPLTVQIKRRETEHQQAARLRSYAYLQQQEEQDAWVDLRYHDEDSEMAHKVWEQLSGVAEVQEIRHTMTRQQYLEAIVPGAASLEAPPQEMDFGGNAGLLDLGAPSSYASRKAMEAAAAAAAALRGAAAWAASGGGAASGAAGAAPGCAAERSHGGWAEAGGEALPEDVVAALPGVVAVALKFAPVLSLEQIRKYIQCLPDGPAKPAGAASDASLHAAVVAGGGVVCIRRCYMHKTLGNPTLDPLRDVVLELLAEREALKRSDIIEAAKGKGIQVSDALYSKVVKELCVSRGAAWSLKVPSEVS